MKINSEIKPCSLVRLIDVCRSFHRTHGGRLSVLEQVDLTILPGQFHALMGRSGSGKSTLMQMVALFDRPSSGSILWQGKDAALLNSREVDYARRNMFGFVHQSHHLLSGMSAMDNVGMPLRIAGMSKKQSRERAQELLEKVGLGDRSHHSPGELSGGERQRVGIARALANRPKLIIADEPTGNLDAETGEQVFTLLDQLRRKEGMAMLLVTHDQQLARRAQFQWRFENRKLVPALVQENKSTKIMGHQ